MVCRSGPYSAVQSNGLQGHYCFLDDYVKLITFAQLTEWKKVRMNGLVPNVIGLFLNMTGFVLNMTGYGLVHSGVVLNMT